MFKTASKMKLDLQINIEDYEAVMYPPGALFDEKSMRTDRSDRIQGKSAHSRQIALCIGAAIFIRKRADIDNSSPISDVMIPNTFCGRRGKRLSKPVVKAVVILSEEPESVILE
jgi:hypothetical protein